MLDELTFDVAPGEIVGLIGPNGAGKTTTLAVLATLLAPHSGEVRIAGHDLRRAPQDVRRSIGRVPQEAALYPSLTGRENVVFFARLRGAPDVPFLLDARTLRAGDHFTFSTLAGGLDVLATPAGGLDFASLRRNARSVQVEDLEVLIADLPDLIRMKRAAGRPKDLIEVEVLAALLEEQDRA